MSWPLKIQGRLIGETDVSAINGFLFENPGWNRSALSRELCRRWDWRRPDGQYKDMACRELLCKLETRSLVKLPPRRTHGPRRAPAVPVVEVDQSPVRCRIAEIQPVSVVDARGFAGDDATFNHLVRAYHYLGFNRTVGQNMKYLVRGHDGRPLGCLLFGAAAWKCEARDQWIGWDAATRERNLQMVCGNTRFLILPWVEVPHLASHVLGACLRRLPGDWLRRYGTRVALAETFVDSSRFAGTCYKAANWMPVGKTKGRGRQDRHTRSELSVKDIWLFPLRRDFRRVLLS